MEQGALESPGGGVGDRSHVELWGPEARGGLRVLGQRLGTLMEARSPCVELGKEPRGGWMVLGKPGMPGAEEAAPAGRKRGQGRKAATAPGWAEKRRKSGGKARGHRGGSRRKRGPGQELSRCTLSPRGGDGTRPSPRRDRNSPVPGRASGCKRPSWGCRSRRVPDQPHLGTRSLVGDPKRREQNPWDTPLVAEEAALPLRGCLAGV